MKFFIILFINLISILLSLASETVKVSSWYCSQYNNTELYFDKDKIDRLTSEQYLLSNFEKEIPQEGARLDYYIRYLHIARGLCYYDNIELAEKSFDNYLKIYNVTDNTQTIDFRYIKTANCYYMYKQFLTEESKSKLKALCKSNFANYYNAAFYFLKNETVCPYPQNKEMISLGDKKDINNARDQYLTDLSDIYFSDIDEDQDCYDPYNEEIVNCGYRNNSDKTEYCNNYSDECCHYKSAIENKRLIEYEPSHFAIIMGSSTALVFTIIGLFFSSIAIKDIKTKEKIEQAVLKQEQMYNNNSHSESQNSLRPPSHTGGNASLPKSQSSGSRPGTPNLHSPSSPYIQFTGSRPGTPSLQSPILSQKELQPSSIIERPPRTPELEKSTSPKINNSIIIPRLELPPPSP
ncbi:hypothetical protein BCR36DRAFT_151772 [Piromyces finnis]|uniref:Uncharacterized protein n=1 Tax=Piromyces finnis TaxID=1754191 RepID=A0A1Y1VK17_9FUNG|nr:hypothetical protein BCR36DRAFT_151772 [Piromyces finnis]|eukprot:ORX57120.1 hypothetical protein BCR36DRAFT_151772 [Piromyces finnis]